MLFDSLAELETFRNKKSCVKSGRWFSWQNACQDHFPEFWASRMLLQSLHEDEKSPDDDARSAHTFADLRKDDNGAGGLRLRSQSSRSADREAINNKSDHVTSIRFRLLTTLVAAQLGSQDTILHLQRVLTWRRSSRSPATVACSTFYNGLLFQGAGL